MTTTRIYKSTDAGAPVVTGQVGAWSSCVQACLVGTSGIAYGSTPAAGWSAAYSGTNKVALRNSLAAGGMGCYSRIDDNGPGAGGAREAFMTTYATMSDVDTGTGITPTAAQIAGGAVSRKSATADSTVRKWVIVADELTWYGLLESDVASATERMIVGGGKFESFVPSDAAPYFCLGGDTVNTTVGSNTAISTTNSFATPFYNTGLWLGRGYSGAGAAIRASIASVGPNRVSGSYSMMSDPAPGSSERFFAPVMIVSEGTIRGRLRGLYLALNNLSAVTNFSQVAGATGLPAGSLLTLGGVASAGTDGKIAIESALEW